MPEHFVVHRFEYGSSAGRWPLDCWRVGRIQNDLPELKILDGKQNLILVPRYDAFMRYASGLAKRGSKFKEIAGNDSIILVSVLSRNDFEKPLFEQPILTQPGWKRIALVVPVGELAAFLNNLDARGALLEHVYDY